VRQPILLANLIYSQLSSSLIQNHVSSKTLFAPQHVAHYFARIFFPLKAPAPTRFNTNLAKLKLTAQKPYSCVIQSTQNKAGCRSAPQAY
jgi:hypothetical protein